MANEIVTHLKGDKNDLERTLKQGEGLGSQFASSMMSKFAAIGGAIAAAFTVHKVVSFFKDAVHEATIAEDTFAKFTVQLKAAGTEAPITADRMKQLASELQEVSKFGDDSTIAAGGALLKFRSLGENFERIIQLSADMADQFGGIEAAANMLGRSLENPEYATRVLRMSGVKLTEQQEEQIKTFSELGESAKAQGIILQELEKRFAGTAKAMGETLTGQSEKLNNQLGDIKETIGFALIPILKDLIPIARELADAYAVLSEEFKSMIDAIPRDQMDPMTKTLSSWLAITLELEASWKALGIIIAKTSLEAQIGVSEGIKQSMQAIMIPGFGMKENGGEGGVFGRQINKAQQNARDQVAQLDQMLIEQGKRIENRQQSLMKRLQEKKDARNPNKDPTLEDVLVNVDRDLELAAAERAARLRREVKLTGGNRRLKTGDEAGFGAGMRGTPEESVRSSVEDLLSLNQRISAAAASSPIEKVEKAVIGGAAKTVEALDKVNAALGERGPINENLNKLQKMGTDPTRLA